MHGWVCMITVPGHWEWIASGTSPQMLSMIAGKIESQTRTVASKISVFGMTRLYLLCKLELKKACTTIHRNIYTQAYQSASEKKQILYKHMYIDQKIYSICSILLYNIHVVSLNIFILYIPLSGAHSLRLVANWRINSVRDSWAHGLAMASQKPRLES